MAGWLAGMAVALAAIHAGAAAAAAAGAASPCPATPAALPAELAGWSRMVPVAAGASAAGARSLTVGTGMRATLLPRLKLSYAVRPEKPHDAFSYGGLFAFDVPAAGRYRVALGSGAWIDVVRDGRALASVAHDHGPDCSGVRKMVDFDLQPGRHVLQIVGNNAAMLPLMVARLP